MTENKRIVFLGAPSTGKTTIAEYTARKFNTIYIPEYGREYWLKHQVNRLLTQEQLLYIAQEQIRQEDEALSIANNFLVVDTNALTTWHFAIDYYGTAHPELDKLAEQSKDRFDVVFLCDDDIPFEDTWERSGDVKRHEFQRFLINQLQRRNIKYHVLSGRVEQRFKTVTEVLARYKII